MRERRQRGAIGPRVLGSLGLLALLAVLGVGFGWLLVRAQARPQGPVPIVWDQQACADCRMHIGEPGFAAQVQLEDGRVLDFDDPGCAIRWLDGHPDPVRALWLHHHTEDRWLGREQAGFVAVPVSPMGYGLATVARDQPGALPWDQAVARVRARGPAKAAMEGVR